MCSRSGEIGWDTIRDVGGVYPGGAPDPGSVVVAEDRRQIWFLFGFLILVFAVALGRGVAGAQTSTGRGVAGIFCAVLLVTVIVGLVSLLRRPARLEVSADVIKFVGRNGRASTLNRDAGNELRFVKLHHGALSRIWTLGLGVVGTDTVIELPGFFARNTVRQACSSCGWRFVN
jgi:hypothetical protein